MAPSDAILEVIRFKNPYSQHVLSDYIVEAHILGPSDYVVAIKLA